MTTPPKIDFTAQAAQGLAKKEALFVGFVAAGALALGAAAENCQQSRFNQAITDAVEAFIATINQE